MKIAGYLRALVVLVTPALILLAVSVLIAGCGAGTALTRAASAGRTDEVMALLDKGADLNEKPFGCEDGLLAISGKGTALSCAAYKGHTAIVKLLLDRGVDVNTKDQSNGGATALVYAAWQGHTSTAKLLIERGADMDDAMAWIEKFGQNNDGFKAGFKFLERLAGKQQPSKQTETLAVNPSQDAYPTVKSDVDELPAIKAAHNKNSYAIVIGIEQYRQKLPQASYATQDAQRVSEYLTKVLGYPEENVITLLNDHATNVDLAKYFEKWLPNNVETGGSVFVYYSGHGAPNPNTGDAYLVPYDGDPSFIDQTGYSLKRMYDALGKLPAKNIVVALDSCFSGAGGRSVLAEGARPLVMNLTNAAALPNNLTVLAAAQGNQISSTYQEKGHGLFTYFLLKGIKNEEVVKPDGSLEIADLYGYIKPQVESIARKKYNNEQSPQLIEAKQHQTAAPPVHAD